MKHFVRSSFEYFGPVSLSRKPKLCGGFVTPTVDDVSFVGTMAESRSLATNFA
jgi:hypothetical protein